MEDRTLPPKISDVALYLMIPNGGALTTWQASYVIFVGRFLCIHLAKNVTVFEYSLPVSHSACLNLIQ
jgi:hypothetical protein